MTEDTKERVDYCSVAWLETLCQELQAHVRSLFERDKFLTSVFIVYGRRSFETGLPSAIPQKALVPFDANDPSHKDVVSAFVKHLAARVDAVAVVTVAEGWMVKAQEGEKRADLMAVAPSDHPRR